MTDEESRKNCVTSEIRIMYDRCTTRRNHEGYLVENNLR